jgi:hypothetical protein
MADEYIRRGDALRGVELFQCGWAEIEAVQADYIGRLPAADVAPVVHARWERVRSNWYCTGCHKGHRITNGAPTANNFAYCPNCGAKMDGGNGNDP